MFLALPNLDCQFLWRAAATPSSRWKFTATACCGCRFGSQVLIARQMRFMEIHSHFCEFCYCLMFLLFDYEILVIWIDLDSDCHCQIREALWQLQVLFFAQN